MKLFLRLVFLLTVASFVFPLKSYADTSCQPIYGGGQSCVTTNNVVINKTVLNPQTNQFVDNLTISDSKYHPGFIAIFQISVTNTGNNTVSTVNIRDIFPQYVAFAYGAGTFNSGTNTLSFNLSNLTPNETRRYSVVGRIINTSQIPIVQGSVICVVNQAIASVDNVDVGQDNAQLCIEKSIPIANVNTSTGFPVYSSVVTTTTAPATGAESWALLALIPTGLTGWFLRKKALKKEIN